MKRGTKVKVSFEGVVINKIGHPAFGVRVSIKKPKVAGTAWWVVIPLTACRAIKRKEE